MNKFYVLALVVIFGMGLIVGKNYLSNANFTEKNELVEDELIIPQKLTWQEVKALEPKACDLVGLSISECEDELGYNLSSYEVLPETENYAYFRLVAPGGVLPFLIYYNKDTQEIKAPMLEDRFSAAQKADEDLLVLVTSEETSETLYALQISSGLGKKIGSITVDEDQPRYTTCGDYGCQITYVDAIKDVNNVYRLELFDPRHREHVFSYPDISFK